MIPNESGLVNQGVYWATYRTVSEVLQEHGWPLGHHITEKSHLTMDKGSSTAA